MGIKAPYPPFPYPPKGPYGIGKRDVQALYDVIPKCSVMHLFKTQ